MTVVIDDNQQVSKRKRNICFVTKRILSLIHQLTKQLRRRSIKSQKKMKTLSAKQLQRNSLQLAITFNNSLPSINDLLSRKEAAEKRIVELNLYFNKIGGNKNDNKAAKEYDQLKSFIGSFDPHGCIGIDGRSPQNKGMRQFLVYGKTSIAANTIFSFTDIQMVYKFLLHCIDFTEDLRYKPQQIFKTYEIKILFVQSVDSSNRPLSWSWVNWDGKNHEWIFAHNESLTFAQSVEAMKSEIAKIITPGEYNICGLKVFIRPEDLDFIPKSGMNYNLRKILSAINHGYVGVNNWAE